VHLQGQSLLCFPLLPRWEALVLLHLAEESRIVTGRIRKHSDKTNVLEPQKSRWAFSASLTSNKPPEKVISRIEQKLLDMPNLNATKTDSFTLNVTVDADDIEFQIIVSTIAGMSVSSVRFHRIHGDSQVYQSIIRDIVNLIVPL